MQQKVVIVETRLRSESFSRHDDVAAVRMLRLSAVWLLMLLGLPAAAQQGRDDYPSIVPRK
ncbi:MAG: hypothetical protein WAK55_14565 [Xanthobacteraceae bacterium]